jgi:hypothetical protein
MGFNVLFSIDKRSKQLVDKENVHVPAVDSEALGRHPVMFLYMYFPYIMVYSCMHVQGNRGRMAFRMISCGGRPVSMLRRPSLCNSGRIWSWSVAVCCTMQVPDGRTDRQQNTSRRTIRTDRLPSCLQHAIARIFKRLWICMHWWMIVSRAGRTCDTAGDEWKGKQGRRDARRSYGFVFFFWPSILAFVSEFLFLKWRS